LASKHIKEKIERRTTVLTPLKMGEDSKSGVNLQLGRLVNYVLLVIFPIWWLVPSALIIGDTFINLDDDNRVSILAAMFYNPLYGMGLIGFFWSSANVYGPVYSYEHGWSWNKNPDKFPQKSDIGFGLSIWMRPLFSSLVICSARLVGLMFYPFWSLPGLGVGIGIEVGVLIIGVFLIKLSKYMFRD
jgi:hypothetical protein